jgi:hypothetical protein
MTREPPGVGGSSYALIYALVLSRFLTAFIMPYKNTNRALKRLKSALIRAIEGNGEGNKTQRTPRTNTAATAERVKLRSEYEENHPRRTTGGFLLPEIPL